MQKIEDYYTPESHRTLVLGITKILHDIFIDAKIEFWINGGLELGHARHGEMIPWDDDADIAMNYKDYMTKLPKLYPIIEKSSIKCNDTEYPLSIQLCENIVKIYVKDLWAQTPTRIIGTPTVDIFPWQVSNNRVELSSIKQRIQFKNCYYMKSELFPLKLYKFGGEYEFWGANNSLPYLFRYYGTDCMKVAKIEIREPTEQNSTNKATKMIEFKL